MLVLPGDCFVKSFRTGGYSSVIQIIELNGACPHYSEIESPEGHVTHLSHFRQIPDYSEQMEGLERENWNK